MQQSEPYWWLADLLSYDAGLASVTVKLGIGADGRVRGFHVVQVRENSSNPFANSPVRRWLAQLEMFVRGFRFGQAEVMARLLDAVFSGLDDVVLALVPLLADLEFYFGALGFRDRAAEAGLAVCLPELVGPEQPRVIRGLFNPLLLASGFTPVPCDLVTDAFASTVLVTGPPRGAIRFPPAARHRRGTEPRDRCHGPLFSPRAARARRTAERAGRTHRTRGSLLWPAAARNPGTGARVARACLGRAPGRGEAAEDGRVPATDDAAQCAGQQSQAAKPPRTGGCPRRETPSTVWGSFRFVASDVTMTRTRFMDARMEWSRCQPIPEVERTNVTRGCVAQAPSCAERASGFRGAQARLHVAEALAMVVALSACDPIRTLSGTVRSVPPDRGAAAPSEVPLAGSARSVPSGGGASESSEARMLPGSARSVSPGGDASVSSEVRPLPGAVVKMTCGARAGMTVTDPDEGARVLAISGPDGKFEYVDSGTWGKSCVVDFESGDGSHEPRRFAISELCKQATGEDECLPIRGITVDLVRQRQPSPPVEVRFRTTPANLELRTDEAATCRTPCEVRVTPGLHRFELFEPGRNGNVWRDQVLVRESTDVTIRHESHRGRQEAAGWFLLPATVGAVLLPIGLLRKNDTLVWTSGGLLAGGTLGFLVIWKDDDVEVTVHPGSPRKR